MRVGTATASGLWGPERRRNAPPFPRLVAESIRLVRAAGRRELTVMLAMQVATIAMVVAAFLVARSLLSALLEADRDAVDVGAFLPEVAALAGLTAALGVANAVQLHRQRLLAELGQRYAERRLLAVTSSEELAAFDEPGFHDAVERAGMAVLLMPALVNGLSGMLRALAGAIGALVALAVVLPAFAPVVLLVLIPLGFAARRRGQAFYRFARDITPRDRERRYLAEVLADRDAAKEVRAFGLAPFLRGRHGHLWDERVVELRAVADRQLALGALANLAASAIVSGALLGLIALTLAGHASLADAGAAVAIIALLGQRLSVASLSAASFSEAALFIEDYRALVDRGGSGEPATSPALSAPSTLEVRAEGVDFSYSGARGPALRDVSVEIAPGEVVALVGENGSGKTTLAKLLAGLYVPDRGRVTWNGTDTSVADRDALRSAVAVIFQDFVRYALPARENIGFGLHDRLADDEAVRRAARTAGAHDDLERLPDGYDTILGPAFAGGTDLSIGQWQRVALARALFRGAPFVILDEPTAALDARAEHDLFVKIRELLAGRSVLLISHRFPSVRMADRIHVMHAGAIVESGTHDELIERDGRYAELFRLQAAPYL